MSVTPDVFSASTVDAAVHAAVARLFADALDAQVRLAEEDRDVVAEVLHETATAAGAMHVAKALEYTADTREVTAVQERLAELVAAAKATAQLDEWGLQGVCRAPAEFRVQWYIRCEDPFAPHDAGDDAGHVQGDRPDVPMGFHRFDTIEEARAYFESDETQSRTGPHWRVELQQRPAEHPWETVARAGFGLEYVRAAAAGEPSAEKAAGR